MCTKCDEIDKKIALCARFLHGDFDDLTTQRIRKMIAELEEQKLDLHEC